jgi:hypothetical protein
MKAFPIAEARFGSVLVFLDGFFLQVDKCLLLVDDLYFRDIPAFEHIAEPGESQGLLISPHQGEELHPNDDQGDDSPYPKGIEPGGIAIRIVSFILFH